MATLDKRASRATTIAVVVSFVLTVIASIRTRGLRETLLFLALGLGLPVSAEYHAINSAQILRHHLQPQYKGVPFAIGLAWYITGYNTFAVLERLLHDAGVDERAQSFLLPIATAATATSMDLVADVALLEQGYWEWAVDGSYAPEVRGPNGKRGVPLTNFSGWLILTSLVTGVFLRLRGKARKQPGGDQRARYAALLLLPSYLGAVAWEVRRRRWRYILASGLFPLALIRALVGKRVIKKAVQR